jgi:lysozyme
MGPNDGKSVSDAGLDFIRAQEGERLTTYRDQAGLPTIGVGHLLRPGETFPVGITLEQSRELLRQDIAWVERALREDVKVPLSQRQFDALASFAFNVGPSAFLHSTLLQKLNAGDYQGAADQLLQWDKVNGQFSAGLYHRRGLERAMFLQDEPTDPDVHLQGLPAPVLPDDDFGGDPPPATD